MRAKLNGYISWDLERENIGLDDWVPEDPENFEITIDFYACPLGENTADAFTVRVCSPKWFLARFGDQIVSTENTIFMPRFDAPGLIKFLTDYCAAVEGETWEAIAVQLTRLGRWEFDYRS